MEKRKTERLMPCNTDLNDSEHDYPCQGCSNLFDGDCWKDSERIDSNQSFDCYKLSNGKIVWK